MTTITAATDKGNDKKGIQTLCRVMLIKETARPETHRVSWPRNDTRTGLAHDGVHAIYVLALTGVPAPIRAVITEAFVVKPLTTNGPRALGAVARGAAGEAEGGAQ